MFRGKLSSFAEDTSFYYVGYTWDEVIQAVMEDLSVVNGWFFKHKMQLSVDMTNYINFSLRVTKLRYNPVRYKFINCLSENNEYDDCKIDCVNI